MALDCKTSCQLLIEVEQRKLIFDNLSLGEMVRDTCSNELGIVIRKKNGWITLLILGGASYHFRELADFKLLCKIYSFDRPRGFTIKELIETFEIRLEWAHTYHRSKIDNLSYIEILSQLREYGHRI